MENVVNPRRSAASFIPHSKAVGFPSGGNASSPDYGKDGAAGPSDVFTSEMMSPCLED